MFFFLRNKNHISINIDQGIHSKYTLILPCDEIVFRTTGINCDQCLDGFTQKAWRRHTREDPFECEKCNCNGHSSKCHFNETVDALGLSMDLNGEYLGGGVCDDCHSYTAGINCETCIDGYFRPVGVFPNDTTPCVPCDCPDPRHTGNCEAENGQCECKEAFRGAEDCSACAQVCGVGLNWVLVVTALPGLLRLPGLSTLPL